MATTIQDGTGTGNQLKVNHHNRLLAESVTLTSEESSISTGDGYQISSGNVTFTAPSSSAILYIKNSEERDFVIDAATLTLGTAVGATATADWLFEVLRNPSAGTIINNAVSAISINANHGSANTTVGLDYKGVQGGSLTDGIGVDQLLKQSVTSYPLRISRRLPKGTSIGFRITPPAGTTSATCELITHWWYDENTHL